MLHQMNINEVEQLLNTPVEHIARQRNIGVKTIAEIKNVVEQIIAANANLENLEAFSSNSVNNMERMFSEEQIDELSHHFVTELCLSNRAINALMRSGCKTMDILAKMSEADIRSLKGLGAKTCDEILQELTKWFESNVFFVEEGDTDEIISEEEQSFYKELTQKISPIISIYWRRIRYLIVNKDSIRTTNYNFKVVNDDCIRKVLRLNELEVYIRKLFLRFAPDGIIRVSELEEQLSSLDLQFNISVLTERISDGTICTVKDNYYYLNRPHVMQYTLKNYSDTSDRNGKIILRRLSGDNLQIIGETYGLTRERIRQILVKTVKRMPLMYEDYFSEPFKYFKLSKEEFCNAFPSCGETGYEYLFIKYKKGNKNITPESVGNYTGCFSERMKTFLGEESTRKDKQTVSRTEMVYRVLLSNSDSAMSMDEFEREYYDYIERMGYPRERLVINQRTVMNHLRNAKHIVFNKNSCVRYCEANPKVIWETIDFTQYKNLVISTELIFRDYAELMGELDIRDGYELYYVIKSSLESWDAFTFAINCRRVPVIVMGEGSEERQAIQLLKEISPIEFQTYYEAYEERFGVRKESAQGNPAIIGALANYYSKGIYSIDVPTIDERDIDAYKETLATKHFWFTEELEREFGRTCVHSTTDAFNSAAFKRLGYSLNVGYAYNDMYSSVVNCFDEEIFSAPIVDLNELDRRLVNLSAFGSAVYKKKMDLEYIEVAPKILMAMSEVERVYGITVNDVRALQEWVLDCNDKYYNAHSLWNELSRTGLAEQLQNNEWMCTCIFRQQDTVASLQVAGGIILCRESNELNLGAICKWLVEKSGRMTIQSLTVLFNDTFSTRVSASKIAEKMKTNRLWDSLVTDSFDEYIDNLVINTELEMDVDELFQEEFF